MVTSVSGILVAIVLVAREVRGALLAGVAVSTAVGLALGVMDWPGDVFAIPDSGDFSTIGDALAPSNLADALTLTLVPVIFALFMSDFFDTIGTAFAVARTGELVEPDGQIPNMRRLLLVDSAAAAGGGAMGVSSVTSYIESGAGVTEGARTGLASLVTAGLFGLTVFAVPLIAVVGQSVQVGEDAFIHPGVGRAARARRLFHAAPRRRDRLVGPENGLPAFLIIVGIPMTFSIAAGIGFGIIGYALVMVSRGKAREISTLMWVLVPLFVAYFLADWLSVEVF